MNNYALPLIRLNQGLWAPLFLMELCSGSDQHFRWGSARGLGSCHFLKFLKFPPNFGHCFKIFEIDSKFWKFPNLCWFSGNFSRIFGGAQARRPWFEHFCSQFHWGFTCYFRGVIRGLATKWLKDRIVFPETLVYTFSDHAEHVEVEDENRESQAGGGRGGLREGREWRGLGGGRWRERLQVTWKWCDTKQLVDVSFLNVVLVFWRTETPNFKICSKIWGGRRKNDMKASFCPLIFHPYGSIFINFVDLWNLSSSVCHLQGFNNFVWKTLSTLISILREEHSILMILLLPSSLPLIPSIKMYLYIWFFSD